MANHIVRHVSNVIRPTVVSAINDVISRPNTSNRFILIQLNMAISEYARPTLSQLNDGNNLGQVIPPLVRILQRLENSINPKPKGQEG